MAENSYIIHQCVAEAFKTYRELLGGVCGKQLGHIAVVVQRAVVAWYIHAPVEALIVLVKVYEQFFVEELSIYIAVEPFVVIIFRLCALAVACHQVVAIVALLIEPALQRQAHIVAWCAINIRDRTLNRTVTPYFFRCLVISAIDAIGRRVLLAYNEVGTTPQVLPAQVGELYKRGEFIVLQKVALVWRAEYAGAIIVFCGEQELCREVLADLIVITKVDAAELEEGGAGRHTGVLVEAPVRYICVAFVSEIAKSAAPKFAVWYEFGHGVWYSIRGPGIAFGHCLRVYSNAGKQR